MDLETFTKIVTDMENDKELLTEALYSQVEAIRYFTEFSMKALNDPSYIPLVEDVMDQMRSIDLAIQQCQDRIALATKILSSDNPN